MGVAESKLCNNWRINVSGLTALVSNQSEGKPTIYYYKTIQKTMAEVQNQLAGFTLQPHSHLFAQQIRFSGLHYCSIISPISPQGTDKASECFPDIDIKLTKLRLTINMFFGHLFPQQGVINIFSCHSVLLDEVRVQCRGLQVQNTSSWSLAGSGRPAFCELLPVRMCGYCPSPKQNLIPMQMCGSSSQALDMSCVEVYQCNSGSSEALSHVVALAQNYFSHTNIRTMNYYGHSRVVT